MRSPLRGMDTQTTLGTDPHPTGPVSTRLILKMTQPSFWLNKFQSGERQADTNFLWQSQSSVLCLFSPFVVSPRHLTLPSHSALYIAFHHIFMSHLSTTRPMEPRGDSEFGYWDWRESSPNSIYIVDSCMVGNGRRQWNSHSSVVLVGELVLGRSRIRNKVVGECYS